MELTKEEKEILDTLEENDQRYIARDKDGALYSYENKPRKRTREWEGYFPVGIINGEKLFSFIKWEDEQPKVAEDLLYENEQ